VVSVSESPLRNDESISNLFATESNRSFSPEEKAAKKEAARKQDRLVDWMVELFTDHIRKIVAMRNPNRKERPAPQYRRQEGKTSLDEVAEVIVLPRFDERSHSGYTNPKEIDISDDVTKQLHHYISIIASHYRDNPFHNFGKNYDGILKESDANCIYSDNRLLSTCCDLQNTHVM
jgi:hypothetical protein